MKSKYSLVIVLFFIVLHSFSQTLKQEKIENEDAQEQQEYDKELTYGINWNTNGGIIGGVNFKFAWQTKQNQSVYHVIGLEIGHVVHPKERLTSSPFAYSSSYVYGKANNLFVVRPHFGREWIVFKKAEEEGIQVSGIVALGPTLAYLKPYYVQYANEIKEGNTITGYELEAAKFDPNDSRPIAGAGSILRGFDEMTFEIGIHAKASLNFEYGKNSGSVGGIEVGVMVEQFRKKLSIIPEAESQSLYGSLFVNVYFGIR